MPRDCIIHNPRSGRSREAGAILRRLADRSDVVVHESVSADHAAQLAVQALERGFEQVTAAGGDGTVNSVANGLMAAGGDSVLGILPLGTANDFARTLAIPDDLERAAKLMDSGHHRPIDLVELETENQRRLFANVATGGNSDRVTEALTDELKRNWGPLCYLRGAIPVLADLRSYDVRVVLDGGAPLQVEAWNIIVANGRTNAGNLAVAPRANPEDGLLDVILIRDGSLGDLAALAGRFALSDYLESEQVLYRQVGSLRIQSRPKMRFSVDGEAIDEQPVAFRIQPGAVRMVVGDEYRAEPDG